MVGEVEFLGGLELAWWNRRQYSADGSYGVLARLQVWWLVRVTWAQVKPNPS
jgi:hypothetical protein